MSYQIRNQRSRQNQHPRPGPEIYHTTQPPVMFPYYTSPGSGYYTYPQYIFTPESFMIALQTERLENQKLRDELSNLQLALQHLNSNRPCQLQTVLRIEEVPPVENTKLSADNAEKKEMNNLKLQISKEISKNSEKDEEIDNLKLQITQVTKENAEKDKENNSLRLQISKETSKNAEKEEEIKYLKLQVTKETSKNGEKEGEIECLKLQITKVTKENAEKEEEIKGLELQISKETSKNAEKEKEIKSLKLQITQLEAKKNKLKCDLEDRDGKVKALLVLNESLMSGNEKRDEKIVQYKTKLKKYMSSSLSSVTELRLGEFSFGSASDKYYYSPSTLTVEHQQSVDQAYLSYIENESYIPSSSTEISMSPVSLESNMSASLTETFMSPVAGLLQQLDVLPASDNESSIPPTDTSMSSITMANSASHPVSDNESTVSINWTEDSLSPVAEDHQKLDSKALNALIALGAENMMGPWFCLLCGKDGQPMSLPSYPEFRQHLIDVHQKLIDPALCEKCGWRSQNDRELDFHMLESHNIQSYFYSFPKSAISKFLKKY